MTVRNLRRACDPEPVRSRWTIIDVSFDNASGRLELQERHP